MGGLAVGLYRVGLGVLPSFWAEEVEEAGRFGFEDGFCDFFENVDVRFGGCTEDVKTEDALSVVVGW
jgi:hypothetical protein